MRRFILLDEETGLDNKVYNYFFAGRGGHLDELAVRRETVIAAFPECEKWQTVTRVQYENGYRLPAGEWLLPGNSCFVRVK